MSPVFTDDNPSEIEGAQLLQLVLDRLAEAESRCDNFEVQAGSMLEGDDRATAYDPISYQVRFLLVAVFDYVGTLRRTLESHGMPMVAAYPLVRAALESAAQVLWLTTGGKRGLRVYRALHRVWDGAKLSDTALRHLEPQRPETLPGLRARLEELLAASKAGQRKLDRPHASMTAIVMEAGKRVKPRQFEPIDVWRLCSSMAHGNRSVSLTVLERQESGARSDIGGTFVMTTSYRVMAAFCGVLADVVDAALDARDALNAT